MDDTLRVLGGDKEDIVALIVGIHSMAIAAPQTLVVLEISLLFLAIGLGESVPSKFRLEVLLLSAGGLSTLAGA